ncbi:MAG: sortase A [Flavobacteriales bacterium]|jgi:sortase A
MKSYKRKLCLVFLLASTSVLWGNSLWIYGKAQLAQVLISQSWTTTLEQAEINTGAEVNIQPWPWADTWPVGVLRFHNANKDLYVLDGAHGSAMAFGPGLLHGTNSREQIQAKVISAHRDTHFSALKHVAIGDQISFQERDGQWSHYRVKSLDVEDSREGPWSIDPARDELHLITCFPFDSILPNGPLRYHVRALPIS